MTITILGATSDLGQALIYTFAGQEVHFILTARRKGRLLPLQKDLLTRRLASSVDLVELDICSPDEEGLKPLAARTDLLICTVGYLGNQEKAMQETTEGQRILQTNFTGPVAVISLFAEAMLSRKSGGIIGISSVAGERGRQSNYYYGSAKAGFTTFLDGLRHRLYPAGIHIMTVLPGFLATKMTADLDLPGPLTAQPARAARAIHRAWNRKRNKIYVLWIWRYIMLLIRNFPEWLFKKTSL